MEFKGTKVFPKYEGGDNTSIDMIFESGAVISIDRRDRYSDKLVMSREEMEANGKLIECAPEMLEMLIRIRRRFRIHPEDEMEIDNLIKKATE